MRWTETLRQLPLLPLLLCAAASANAADVQKLKIEAPDGRDVVVFKHRDGILKVEDGDRRLLLKAKPHGDGGRKYKGPRGGTVAKVTGTGQGFKVKTERGGLLWKVKRQGNRIKVAANEGNVMADELKRTGADKWVAERDGTPYGKVKRYPGRHRIKVKDAGGREQFRVKSGRLSPMFAVLLIPGIPREEAYIIMAEMWLRGW
jgi:hypothetical protein